MSSGINCCFAFLIAGAILLVGAAAGRAAEPTWESLRHEPTEWLLDAKFGIYMHWGVYCVPAYKDVLYGKLMYQPDSDTYKHHVETYGDPKDFPYDRFVEMFKAEKFDAAVWAKVIKASGARYAGMAVVHHDGFLLWASKVNRWNAGNMGPKRDCYGELVKALRAEGLKTVATFHHLRTYNFYLPGAGFFGENLSREASEIVRKNGWSLGDPNFNDLYWNELAGGKYNDFLKEWRAKVREVIDNYQPDVVWFDGGPFRTGATEKYTLDVLSHYQDSARQRGQQVEVLNKLPTTMKFNFPREYGVLTFEEGRDRDANETLPFVDDMRIGDHGWCYIEGQQYKTANEVIDGIVDRAARGGGTLLNISPRPDGTIPDAQVKTLEGIGTWLKVNGEAVFNTRPWKVAAEGDQQKLKYYKRWWHFDKCDGSDIRFTRNKDATRLYVIVLGWPEGGKLHVASLGDKTRLADGPVKSVTLLDGAKPAQWSRSAAGMDITLPQGTPQDQPAYAFRIDVEGKLDLGQ
jgi:alpha-L-fucosidase